jgi:hypothetical protein
MWRDACSWPKSGWLANSRAGEHVEGGGRPCGQSFRRRGQGGYPIGARDQYDCATVGFEVAGLPFEGDDLDTELPSSYPPAMAPTMRRGSVPAATALGRGASDESWDRSCSQAKNRMKARPGAAVVTADGPAQHRVARPQGVEH